MTRLLACITSQFGDLAPSRENKKRNLHYIAPKLPVLMNRPAREGIHPLVGVVPNRGMA
jgi:hypothetical protein